MARATRSALPPGGNVTTRRTGLLGQVSCAASGPLANVSASTINTARRIALSSLGAAKPAPRRHVRLSEPLQQKAQAMTILDALKADHDKAKALLKQILDTDDAKSRTDLFK